jgi:hypothetical protein
VSIPSEFVNLNRVRFSYKGGKTQVTLKKSFRMENLPYLKHIHRLDTVNFEDWEIVNPTVLTELAPLNLRYLQIGRNNQCMDSDLEVLKNWKELEILNLHCNGKITDAGLAHIRKLKRLRYLYVYCNSNITDKGLIPLTFLPQLERLCIVNNRGLPKADITGESWLRPGCPTKLQELTMVGNWTSIGFAKLCRWIARLPQLENLDLRYYLYNKDDIPEDDIPDYSDYHCLPDDGLAPLVELFGKPQYEGAGMRWEAIQSRKKIVAFLQQEQTPVSRWDMQEDMQEKKGDEKYVSQALKILLARGIVEEFKKDEGYGYASNYRLTGSGVPFPGEGFPWELEQEVF